MPKKQPLEVLAAIPEAQAAVPYLRDQGQEKMADAVDVVLRYFLDPGSFKDPDDPEMPLSLYMPTPLRDRVHEKAGATPVTALVLDGLEKFLAGEWEPAGPVPVRSELAGGFSTISVRVGRKTVKAVDAKAAELKAEKGWKRMDNARRIAITYLYETYVLPDLEQDTAATS